MCGTTPTCGGEVVRVRTIGGSGGHRPRPKRRPPYAFKEKKSSQTLLLARDDRAAGKIGKLSQLSQNHVVYFFVLRHPLTTPRTVIRAARLPDEPRHAAHAARGSRGVPGLGHAPLRVLQ